MSSASQDLIASETANGHHIIKCIKTAEITTEKAEQSKEAKCTATEKAAEDSFCYCWYKCTVSGGREEIDLDVVNYVKICEKLGAGEVLLNCIDNDGTNNGFDLDLIKLVRSITTLPIIASSGAGCSSHFVKVFEETNVEAALAAGVFHKDLVSIQVKF